MLMNYNINTTSFELFKDSIKNIPLLSEEEEISLFKKYKEENCQVSVQKLVIHHLRFVSYIANNFRGYNLPQEDLIQEGVVGLMKGIKNYALDAGTRICTYVVHHIKYCMNEYIIKNLRIYRLATTKDQRKIFFNKSMLNDHSNSELAEKLNVSEKELETMRCRLEYDISYEQHLEDKDGETHALHLPSNDLDILDKLEYEDNLKLVSKCINKLSTQEQDIISARYLSDDTMTFQELSKIYNVSHQRIEQIEKKAIKKLNKMIEEY